MKRPRGLWKSHRSSEKPSPSELRPEDGTPDPDGDEDGNQSAKRPKRDGSLENDDHDVSGRAERALDIDDWDDLKQLFHIVIEKYEGDNLTEAVELLRGVIHECNRLLRLHPSILFTPSSHPHASPQLGRLSPPDFTPSGTSATSALRDWADDVGNPGPPTVERAFVTRPTTFHYMYGTALFLLGKIVAAEPTLAKEGEPAGSPAFYLAALDVFEMGESLPKRWDEHGSSREDWRMAIVWGRCLVYLADEKLCRMEIKNTTHAGSSHESSPPQVDFQHPVWPQDSAFASVSHRRLPVTRRTSLQGSASTPHEILLQATDQFSRGMLHMPNARRPRSAQQHHKGGGGSYFSQMHHPAAEEELEEIDAPPTLPGLGVLGTRNAASIRPRVLYTIANDVMSVAERMPDPATREYWANWSDIVFKQMEMESDVYSWVYATAVGRGRCWLIIGAARAEALEASIESIGEAALQSDEAAEAREALQKAIEHFERSRAIIRQPDLRPQQDPYGVELSPLIGEVLVTLAALTLDETEKSSLFARASTEGVNINDSENDENHDTDMHDIHDMHDMHDMHDRD